MCNLKSLISVRSARVIVSCSDILTINMRNMWLTMNK